MIRHRGYTWFCFFNYFLCHKKKGKSAILFLAAVAQEYLWLDWFFFSREGLLLAFCFSVFVLKCYAWCAWKMNNLYKEYVNRPTHTSQETHAHRLFVQGRPLLRKNDLFSVSPAPHITDRLNDWAFCVCVNGLSRVGICIKVTAMEIGEMLNEQDRVRKSERDRRDEGKRERVRLTERETLDVTVLLCSFQAGECFYKQKRPLTGTVGLEQHWQMRLSLSVEGILSAVSHVFQCRRCKHYERLWGPQHHTGCCPVVFCYRIPPLPVESQNTWKPKPISLRT